MIAEHFDDLETVTSTKQACELLGASSATVYGRRRPPILPPLASSMAQVAMVAISPVMAIVDHFDAVTQQTPLSEPSQQTGTIVDVDLMPRGGRPSPPSST